MNAYVLFLMTAPLLVFFLLIFCYKDELLIHNTMTGWQYVLLSVVIVDFLLYDGIKKMADSNIISATALVVCLSLLLFASYTDQLSQQIYVFPMILAVLIEMILVIAALLCGTLHMPRATWAVVFIITLALLIMGLFGYTLGDFGILLVCECTYLIVCREFMGAIMVTLFVSAFTAFIRNLFRLKKTGSFKKRFPFTMYIAIGTCTALYLFL